jgi:hypothetical protein
MSEPMLGRAVDPSEYGTLDTFPVERPVRVRFETAELEALCPAVEGIQPDIYRCVIEYRADDGVARVEVVEVLVGDLPGPPHLRREPGRQRSARRSARSRV